MFLQPLINMGLNRPGWNPSGGANFAKLLQNQKTKLQFCQNTLSKNRWLAGESSLRLAGGSQNRWLPNQQRSILYTSLRSQAWSRPLHLNWLASNLQTKQSSLKLGTWLVCQFLDFCATQLITRQVAMLPRQASQLAS